MTVDSGETRADEPSIGAPSAGSRPPTSAFVRRVTAIFATRVVILPVSLLTSVLVARVLGPELRGAYATVVTLPGLISAFALLGLPNAVNYFAGRGSSVSSLVRASLAFTAVLSVVLVGIVWFALPSLERSFLKAAAQQDDLLRVMLLTLPLGMLASFGGTLLYGRQEVKVYNLILVGQAVLSLAGSVLLVVVLRLSVPGAVAVSVFLNVAVAVAVMAEVSRLRRRDTGGEPAPMRRLLVYGARLYPASVTGYFNARADVYILQALALSTAVAEKNVGLYGFAVTMAELVFYVPESVATMFLPRVAASSHEDASAMLGRVSRLTMLVTLMVAVALIPAAYVGIHLVLPKYSDCLPAFYAILPGVVSLSLSKVMTSYIAGRGRPGPISVAASISLAVNVVCNFILIPQLGIVGASLSSVVSYTALAAMMVAVASRISGQSVVSLCVPRPAELRIVVSGAIGMTGRLLARALGKAARVGR